MRAKPNIHVTIVLDQQQKYVIVNQCLKWLARGVRAQLLVGVRATEGHDGVYGRGMGYFLNFAH